jgi:hypothetical protein
MKYAKMAAVAGVVKTGENKLKVLVTSTAIGKPALGDVKRRMVSSQRIE